MLTPDQDLHAEMSPEPPKFKEGDLVTNVAKSVFRYRILEAPPTCIFNSKPAYFMACLNPEIKTPPFHRLQEEVERDWTLYTISFKYDVGTHIRHKKSGGLYRIIMSPDFARLEATGEPAYFYKSLQDGLVWARSQVEMEDGRFEPALLGDSSAV